MTSKVIVQMPLCTNKTVIEATDRGNGIVDLRFESHCCHIKDFAKALTEASYDDYVQLVGSRVLRLAEENHLTATCLVPVAVFNACWVETGMISKSLARKEPNACIIFDV
jgi:hypothetical protein